MTTIYLHNAEISESNPFNVSNILPGLPYLKHLSLTGDSGGSGELNADYSAATTKFYYQPTTGTKFYIHNVLIKIADDASFNMTDYGGISGGLTNGVTFYVSPDGGTTEIPLLGGHVFKQNYHWAAITPHFLLTTFSGTAQTLTVNINLIDQFGAPLALDGTAGHQFIVRLHDNFSTLVGHHFALQGRVVAI